MYGEAPHCRACSRVESVVEGIAADGAFAPRFDVSKSFDGAIVVSDAFRDVCVDVPGITFTPLSGGGHWTAEVDRVVAIEPFESHVRWGPPCEACDQPRYVTRSGPLRLQADGTLPSGFSCTDVEFGDTADFGPSRPVRLRSLVLVDRATARLLKSASLLGIHLITQP